MTVFLRDLTLKVFFIIPIIKGLYVVCSIFQVKFVLKMVVIVCSTLVIVCSTGRLNFVLQKNV